jgi:hypothetical protein
MFMCSICDFMLCYTMDFHIVKMYKDKVSTKMSKIFFYHGGLNQILKRQTSRFHCGSKFPAVTITVFTTILEQNW